MESEMKCSKCGDEIKNFPEHLAGIAKVVCSKCIGALPPTMDLESIRERYLGRTKKSVEVTEDDLAA